MRYVKIVLSVLLYASLAAETAEGPVVVVQSIVTGSLRLAIRATKQGKVVVGAGDVVGCRPVQKAEPATISGSPTTANISYLDCGKYGTWEIYGLAWEPSDDGKVMFSVRFLSRQQ